MDLVDIDKVLDEFEASENAKTICPQKTWHYAKKNHEEEWFRNKAELRREESCVSSVEDPPNDDGVLNQENNIIVLDCINDKVDGTIFEKEYHIEETKMIGHFPDIESQNSRTTNEMGTHNLDMPAAPSMSDFTDRELTEEELNAYLADVDVNDAEISRIFENLATLTHVDQILDENSICEGDSSKSVNEIDVYKNQQNAETSETQNDKNARVEITTTNEDDDTVVVQAGKSQAANTSPDSIEISVADSPDVPVDATVETQSACEIADVSYENDHSALEQCGGSLVTIKHISDEISDPWKPTESELQLGEVEPIWIPDQDSSICMLCESRFTLIKRRHHCRACGRVLCMECCNVKRKLPYSENLRDVRICTSCNERLNKIEEYKKALMTTTSGTEDASVSVLNGIPPDSDDIAPAGVENVSQSLPPLVLNTPADSVTPLARETTLHSPNPVVKRCTPVLKQASSKREPKRVIFSDGIKPGFGQIQYFVNEYESGSPSRPNASESAESTVVCFALPTRSKFTDMRTHELCSFSSQLDRYSLYPIIKDGTIIGYVKDQYLAELFQVVSDTQTYEVPDQTESDSSMIVKFALKHNLSVAVKRACTKLCGKSQYLWCFASRGLKNVCADEILIILAEDIPDENEETKFTSKFFILKPLLENILRFYEFFYETALKGTLLSDMVYIGLPDNLNLSLGRAENAGFLLFRPTFQCLTSLLLPEDPFLIGLLMKNNESPWAKILPLRLLLRLGLEYQSYPFPIVSYPNRQSVFVDHGGNTIMKLLNDFRSFTYTITYVIRMWIMLLENDRIVISIPNDQFCTMQRIIESSNEHVLAFAASFCKIADLHLVCMQNQENGSYSSYSIEKNIERDVRKTTGCTFVVFNVSSKTGGANFRTSIVEDGIMVQMRQEVLTSVKEKLMKHENIEIKDQATSYSVGCISNSGASIEIRWENVRKSDLKIYSSVDGRWLGDGIRFRLSGRNIEVSSKTLLIRLVSLFILPPDEDETSPSCDPTLNDPPDDLYVLIKKISTSLAAALLTKAGDYFAKNNQVESVGVRFAYGFDTVEYSVGIDGSEIPKALLSITDDCLIPILSDSVRPTELSDASAARNRFCANVELMLRLLRV